MLSSCYIFLRDHFRHCGSCGRLRFLFVYVGTISVFIFNQRRDYSYYDNLGIKRSSLTLSVEPILLRSNASFSSLVDNNVSDKVIDYNGWTLAKEIQSIYHIPEEGKIVVQFKRLMRRGAVRLCKDPFLVGRLSGPFLSYHVRWEKVFLNYGGCVGEDRDERCREEEKIIVVDKMVWRYNVPEPGRYFVEILGLLCNDVGFNSSITNVCLVDSKYLRVTHEFATVDVIKASPLKIGGGYWRWSLHKNSDHVNSSTVGTDHVDPSMKPLLTRYQPVGCRDVESNFCLDAVSTDRFGPYEFYFVDTGNESNNTLHSLISSHDKAIRIKSNLLLSSGVSNGLSKPIKLCFVGASHSREMAKTFGNLFRSWGATNIITSSLVFVRYPELIDNDFIKKEIIDSGCTKSIVAVGQWPLGTSNPPVSFPEFLNKYLTLMNSLRYMNTSGVYMRSIHLNPLGDVKLTCPPTDWRNPPAIGIYNDIILNLTKFEVTNIPFVDTDVIIGPMWDSAPDFCHYPSSGKVAVAEALYILDNIL